MVQVLCDTPVMLLFISSVVTTNALECWYGSTLEPPDPKQFKSPPQIVNCHKDRDTCYKVVSKVVGGYTATEQGCVSKNDISCDNLASGAFAHIMEAINSITNSTIYKNIECVTCQHDNCNNSGMRIASDPVAPVVILWTINVIFNVMG